MKKYLIPSVVGVVLLVFLYTSFFSTNEWEQAIVLQLGKPVKVVTKAGLHFKIPLIQSVTVFDQRWLEWDGDPEVIPTSDRKFIFVDAFARWKISDPLTFFKKVTNESGGQSRLDDILDGLVRDSLSTHSLLEIIRSSDTRLNIQDEANSQLVEGFSSDGTPMKKVVFHGLRAQLTKDILKAAQERLANLDLGMELVDIEIKRLDYTPQVTKKVYRRMVSRQNRLAEKYRAQGQGKKAEILGRRQQKANEIRSEAYKKSQKILGDGEKGAASIYAAAYSRDPDFYRFIKTLETYEKSVNEKGVLMITTDSELFHYLKTQK